MTLTSSIRVLVAGSGVAGLEALLGLRDLAGDRVALTLVTPETQFVHREMAVAETFARGHTRPLPLERLSGDLGVELIQARLERVDDRRRVAYTHATEPLPYDALLVAVGATSEPAFRRAITWTPEADPEIFGGLRRDLEEGYSSGVAFVVPPGIAWPLPAYELALMTAWALDGMGRDDIQVTLVTPESAPLEAFGVAGSAAVRADLDDAGIAVETGAYLEDQGGRFVMQPGQRPLAAQRVVALPRAVARTVPGLAADRRGFIRVDRHCRVAGAERAWAAGDAIAFPLKQGGLAAQQADAAAQSIAALAGASVEPQPFHPVLRGVLLTGRGREWLRHDIGGGSGEARSSHRALWWPPAKVAGRYLSPYLEAIDVRAGAGERPTGEPVELDLGSHLPAAADALDDPPADTAPPAAYVPDPKTPHSGAT
jgi:sulfide:quinone oxidoreductase